MSALSGAPALAGEFDLLGAPAPTTAYVVDDANVLSKATRGELNSKLKNLEITTGYRLNVLTVRKLEFETDPFAFADKVDEQWYPEAASLDKKGALLIVTTAKSGAVTGGPSFNKAVGDDLVDSIITDNIPIYSEAEAYNQVRCCCADPCLPCCGARRWRCFCSTDSIAWLPGVGNSSAIRLGGGLASNAAVCSWPASAQAVLSSVARLEAKLQGNEVPAAPVRNEQVRKRNYKTKEETEKSKTVTATIVAVLLLIAFVVPMLQYYGYTARD